MTWLLFVCFVFVCFALFVGRLWWAFHSSFRSPFGCCLVFRVSFSWEQFLAILSDALST